MKQLAYFLFIILGLSNCAGCSKSGSRRPPRLNRADRTAQTPPPAVPTAEVPNRQPFPGVDSAQIAEASRPEPAPGGKTEIDMVEENGVYKVPVYVNDVPMTFIFDTGASDISLSATEAAFLYRQGSLTQADIIGKAQFSDANGDISTGTVIRLNTVRIGDRTLRDVRATVVENDRAPLLLGQSALAQFGKISIDYQRKKIVFE